MDGEYFKWEYPILKVRKSKQKNKKDPNCQEPEKYRNRTGNEGAESEQTNN